MGKLKPTYFILDLPCELVLGAQVVDALTDRVVDEAQHSVDEVNHPVVHRDVASNYLSGNTAATHHY